jgi:hypothetical protein
MTFNRHDMVSGGLVAATGLFFALTALRTLPVGTMLRMGPGYFPAAIGFVVTGLGLMIMAGALKSGQEKPAPLRLRPLIMIPAAILSFLLTIRGAGLIPAVFLVVVVSRAADPASRLAGTLMLAIAMCAMCAAIFVYGLNLPLPLFGRWLRGF